MPVNTQTTTSSSESTRRNQFRLQACNLFLTWPQCATTKEEVLEKIKEKFGDQLDFAVVAAELHEDGAPHLHAVVSLREKFRSRDPNCLDSLANSHGNYQSARKMRDCVKYVVKDGDFTSHGVDISAYLQAAKTKKSTKATKIATRIMDGATLQDLLKEEPGFVLQNLQKLRNFQLLVRSLGNQPTLTWAKLSPALNSLSPPLMQLVSWLNENMGQKRRLRQKQLLLSSPPGLGKTTLMEKICEYFRVYPHVGGKWFDGYEDGHHQVIVMDEFVGGVPMTVMNKILDGQRCTLEIKGASIWKTTRVPVIILTNKTDYNLYSGEKVDEVIRAAFFDRVQYIRLEQGDEPWRILPYFNGALESAEEMPDDSQPSSDPTPLNPDPPLYSGSPPPLSWSQPLEDYSQNEVYERLNDPYYFLN